MKYSLLFLLFSLGFGTPAIAEETSSENVAGITLYNVDEPSDQVQPSSWQAKTQEIIFNALSLTGIKYKYGGNSPATGFDCSGFVRYVFLNAAHLSLPPTARAISQIGQAVNKNELQPGDLVFFNTLKSAFSHVGIYIGDNKFIHAPSAGKVVRVENMQDSYWVRRFSGGQRLDKEAEKSAANSL